MIAIFGIPTAGKTITADKMGKDIGVPVFSTDYIYDDIARSLGVDDVRDFCNPKVWKEVPEIDVLKEEYYKKFLENVPSNAILEGHGLCYKKDQEIIKKQFKDVLFMYFEIDMHTWAYRKNIELNETRVKEFENLLKDIHFPDEYYIVNERIDLFLPDANVYSGIDPDFVRKKFESLNLGDLTGKTLIDLGGNSGEMVRYAYDLGIIDGVVMDYNWKHLERAKGLKRFLFNAEYLDDITTQFDVVLSISMYHYLTNRRKFIQSCARITKWMFVLETPIDGGIRKDGVHIPTQDEILELLSDYFDFIEVSGKSPSPDGSNRVVYKAFK